MNTKGTNRCRESLTSFLTDLFPLSRGHSKDSKDSKGDEMRDDLDKESSHSLSLSFLPLILSLCHCR